MWNLNFDFYSALTLDALAYVGTCPAIELIDVLTRKTSCLGSSRKRELVVSLSAVPLRYCSPCKLLKTVTVSSVVYICC